MTAGPSTTPIAQQERRPRENDGLRDGGGPAFDRTRTPPPPVDSASDGEAEPQSARALRTR
jgi:hypothetical protein